MKKLIIVILLLLSTGCTLSEIKSNNFRDLADELFEKEVKHRNYEGNGYSYYLPNNVMVKNEIDENAILYSNGNYFYLYIDLVSYKKKEKFEYEESFSYYISKKITNGKKQGYLQITKLENQYFVEMGYNYAKIESYVYYHELKSSIISMSRILNSIKYNEKIINSLIEKTENSNKAVDFNIKKPGVIENNYIDNIEEDVTDTTGTISDTDNIEIKFEE